MQVCWLTSMTRSLAT